MYLPTRPILRSQFLLQGKKKNPESASPKMLAGPFERFVPRVFRAVGFFGIPTWPKFHFAIAEKNRSFGRGPFFFVNRPSGPPEGQAFQMVCASIVSKGPRGPRFLQLCFFAAGAV